jgi:hypothetical protein
VNGWAQVVRDCEGKTGGKSKMPASSRKPSTKRPLHKQSQKQLQRSRRDVGATKFKCAQLKLAATKLKPAFEYLWREDRLVGGDSYFFQL